jgi:hypothetical protein
MIISTLVTLSILTAKPCEIAGCGGCQRPNGTIGRVVSNGDRLSCEPCTNNMNIADYQPPDNGAPDKSGGSGTRFG